MTDLPDLPAGWRWSTVADVGKVQLGRQRAPQHHRGEHMRPYLRVANVFEDRIDTTDVMEMNFTPDEFERYRLHPGDILLNEGQSPELLGRPAMYRGDPVETAFTNSLIRFQAGDGVLSEWALIVFRHHMHSGRFKRECRVTTNIAHLSANRFKTIEFPVPPLEVQRRLVAQAESRLETIRESALRLTQMRQTVSALRQSLLTSAVNGRTGGARTTWDQSGTDLVAALLADRRASPEPHRLPALPSGWATAQLGDLFDIAVGTTPSRSDPALWNGTIPWVSSGEVAFNRIRSTRERITNAGLGNADKRLHPPGTVLLAMIGEGKTRGQAAVLDVAAAHNQNCASIRVAGTGVDPNWIFWCLAERYERTRQLGAGNNQPALSKRLVSQIVVPIPPPAVQIAVAEELDRQATLIDGSLRDIEALTRKHAALTRSVLAEAVRGGSPLSSDLEAREVQVERQETLTAGDASSRRTGTVPGRAKPRRRLSVKGSVA